MKLIAFLLSIFLIVHTKGIGQEYNYYRYDVEDGLSGNTVYAIAQDKDSYLWFATETGLSRFDGIHFKNYTAIDGLPENEIINLFVDSKNRVWIFPFKNSIYYYYEGKIHNASNDTLLKKFGLKNEIFQACEDKNGNIFFLEPTSLHILPTNNNLTVINKIDNRYFTNNHCGISEEGYCNLLLGALNTPRDQTIRVYEYRNSQFIQKTSFQDSNFTRNAFEMNAHYSVVKNDSFFQIYNQKINKKFKIKVPPYFHTISYLNDSSFAISTFNRTLLFNVNQKKIVDSFLTNKLVNRCFQDNENNLWFATMTQGLYRLSSTKFTVYRIKDDVNFIPIYALGARRDSLYIGGSKNSLWNLNLRNRQLKKLNLKTDSIISQITEVQPFDDRTLFLGSNKGLYKIFNNQSVNYLPVVIKSFFIHNNLITVATDRAVFELSLFEPRKRDTIWNNRATCAYKLDDEFYVGTLNGLYITKNEHNSTIDIGNNFPALKDKIIAISADFEKKLWIITESHGLICLKNNKIIYELTTRNGLLSDVSRCLFISGNTLWLGTNKGISKVDISNHNFKITNYTAAEGLDCEIINCIYAKGDSVFAGTPFGVTFFEADKIQTKSICELKLIDIQSRNDNWYYKQESINLERNDNSLRFEYTGISFVSSGDITYYYQLKGLDSAWQSTKQNSIQFQSLPPGNYEFNLYAINRYGIKSKMITIPFSKEKTFWQLLWVRGMLVVIVAFIIWLVFRARMKIVKRKANEKISRERKIYELEQMALRSQMNPHFIFNSLNSLQQCVFAGDAIEANRFITNFSSLVRQTLYISGKKFITLDEEIKYLESYLTLEQVKYENIFNFQIVVSEDVSGNIMMPPLLLQPFIENSIRHGVLNLEKECGKILIQFWIENNSLVCILEDNGIGREHAMKLKNTAIDNHRSKGMELVQKRIENLNSIYNVNIVVSIEDVMEKNKTGTLVKIQLPLNYDNN
ncbi:MAG TPA: histidine kinase [Parafilimonas sp.]|nr:histidine kinase [Parafilimonas sp.]